MTIHADYSEEGGPSTNDWLEYLWMRGYEGSNDPHIQAWVLGFLCHAAGDMFIHTFLNYFSGGHFVISDGDNGARHILFEGYIAKRQPGPQLYTVDLPDSVKDFIYENLVRAEDGTELRKKLLIGDAGAFYSPPLRFSQLKENVQYYLIDHFPTVSLKIPLTDYDLGQMLEYIRAYAREWVKDIDKGLRAWVDFSHDFAVAFFFQSDEVEVPYTPQELALRKNAKENIERLLRDYEVKDRLDQSAQRLAPEEKLQQYVEKVVNQGILPEESDKAEKKDRVQKIVLDYTFDHLLSMLVFPDVVGLKARDTYHYLDVALDTLKDHLPQYLRDFLNALKGGMLDFISRKAYGLSYRDLKRFNKEPEIYFDKFLNTSGKLGNLDARTVSLKEANQKYLKLKDDAYGDKSERWQWQSFEPAFNTVQMIKMMFMKKEEVNRLMDDLHKMIYKQGRSPHHLDRPNVMLGFCTSIDESNSWRHGRKMLAARDDKYWVQLFMHHVGAIQLPPYPVERPVPPGGIITKVSFAPQYLQGYKKFHDFRPKEFLHWFYTTNDMEPERYMRLKMFDRAEKQWRKSNESQDRAYYDEHFDFLLKKMKEKNEIVPRLIRDFYASLTLDEKQVKTVKAGEDFVFEVDYALWGYQDKEVQVKIVVMTDDKRAVLTPYQDIVIFGEDKEAQTGRATISFACKYPMDKDETKMIGLELYVNNVLKSAVNFRNVYKVESAGADYEGYGMLRVEVKYKMHVPDDWQGSAHYYYPELKVTLIPLDEQDKKSADEKKNQGQETPGAQPVSPLTQTGKKKSFRFDKIPLGRYKVVVEVVPEDESETSEDVFDDSLYSREPPDYRGPKRGEAFVTISAQRPWDPAGDESSQIFQNLHTVIIEMGDQAVDDIEQKKDTVQEKTPPSIIQDTKADRVQKKAPPPFIQDTKRDTVQEETPPSIIQDTKADRVQKKAPPQFIQDTKANEAQRKQPPPFIRDTRIDTAQRELPPPYVQDTGADTGQREVSPSDVQAIREEMSQIKLPPSFIQDTKADSTQRKLPPPFIRDTKANEAQRKQPPPFIRDMRTDTAQRELPQSYVRDRKVEVSQVRPKPPPPKVINPPEPSRLFVRDEPKGGCVDPEVLRPPRSEEDVPRVLEGMGFEILTKDNTAYTIQIKDFDCAARYGYKEMIQWRAGRPPEGARYRLKPGRPIDDGAYVGIIGCFTEIKNGMLNINLMTLDVDITDCCLVPDFMGDVARDWGNTWYDSLPGCKEANKCSRKNATQPPAPQVPQEVDDGIDRLLGETFEYNP